MPNNQQKVSSEKCKIISELASSETHAATAFYTFLCMPVSAFAWSSEISLHGGGMAIALHDSSLLYRKTLARRQLPTYLSYRQSNRRKIQMSSQSLDCQP